MKSLITIRIQDIVDEVIEKPFPPSGHMKDSNRKECILIIDHETGEITLERLSKQIAVKKTRPERPEKGSSSSNGGGGLQLPTPAASSSSSRPSTPLDQLMRRGGGGGSNRASPSYSTSRHGSRSNSPAPPPTLASDAGAVAAAAAASTSSDYVGFGGLSAEDMFPDFHQVPAASDKAGSSSRGASAARKHKKPPSTPAPAHTLAKRRPSPAPPQPAPTPPPSRVAVGNPGLSDSSSDDNSSSDRYLLTSLYFTLVINWGFQSVLTLTPLFCLQGLVFARM